MQGVRKTLVGYTGGTASRPTYKSVCGGDGHTEAIQITFDPEQISYEDLLRSFFQQHSPKSSKVQYKSAIWYADEEQRNVAEQVISSQGSKAQKHTDLLRATTWHNAEAYHQKYVQKKRGGC